MPIESSRGGMDSCQTIASFSRLCICFAMTSKFSSSCVLRERSCCKALDHCRSVLRACLTNSFPACVHQNRVYTRSHFNLTISKNQLCQQTDKLLPRPVSIRIRVCISVLWCNRGIFTQGKFSSIFSDVFLSAVNYRQI